MQEFADQITQQRGLLQSWVQSPEARNLAGILIRRRNLDQDPDDLIGEAWLKITRTFAQRTDPLPAMTSVQEASRYGARVIDNLCRDLARKNFRRRETSLEVMLTDRSGDQALATSDTTDDTETRVMLEQVLLALGRNIEAGFTCAGCPNHVAAATAFEVVHMVLAGEEGDAKGRSWLDQMLYVALEKVDPVTTPKSDAARTQRKSRCGRCVTELLNAALTSTLEESR